MACSTTNTRFASKNGRMASGRISIARDTMYLCVSKPHANDADGAAQLKLALEVGGWVRQLYDNLAKIRDGKKQAADIASTASGRLGASRKTSLKISSDSGPV